MFKPLAKQAGNLTKYLTDSPFLFSIIMILKVYLHMFNFVKLLFRPSI